MTNRFTRVASHPSYLPCGVYLPRREYRTKDLNTDALCHYCRFTICFPHCLTPQDVRTRQRQHTSACRERENRLIERLLSDNIILRAAFHPWNEACWKGNSRAMKTEDVRNVGDEPQHLDVVCSSCRKVVCLVQPYPTFCDQLQEHLERRCEKRESQSRNAHRSEHGPSPKKRK